MTLWHNWCWYDFADGRPAFLEQSCKWMANHRACKFQHRVIRLQVGWKLAETMVTASGRCVYSWLIVLSVWAFQILMFGYMELGSHCNGLWGSSMYCSNLGNLQRCKAKNETWPTHAGQGSYVLTDVFIPRWFPAKLYPIIFAIWIPGELSISYSYTPHTLFV